MIKVLMVKSISYIALILILLSCKYKLSTYSAATPNQDLNKSNLLKIKNQEPSSSPTFKIAFIADSHNYYEDLAKLIKKINTRSPVDFVIICGDITTLGLLEEYDHSRQFFNDLKYPYLVAIGNHDLLANGKIIFERMFGKNNFSFTYHDVQFVIFNNNNWESAGMIPDIDWVRNTIVETNAPRRVLISHIGPEDTDRFTAAEIQNWVQLVDTLDVSYFLHGHNHNPTEGIFGQAKLITIGAPSKGSYLELIIEPGGMQHQRINF